MMKTDDLENELRNLKYLHLTESELAAYCDQELDQMRRARFEAHLKQCFICERQLRLLREENAALSHRQITAADVAFVERLMEQRGRAQKPSATRPAETAKGIPLQERLAECLRQMVASWQIQFAQEATRSVATRSVVDQGEELWRWQSQDGFLQGHAIREKNADLTIHFSSNEPELAGARLNVRLGPLSQEVTLRRVSDSEVYAKVAVPRRQRPRKMADLSIESI
jgi:hypothetical protein